MRAHRDSRTSEAIARRAIQRQLTRDRSEAVRVACTAWAENTPACAVCVDAGCEFCPAVDRWPEGWHAADHLHPFDCTPADLNQEDV